MKENTSKTSFTLQDSNFGFACFLESWRERLQITLFHKKVFTQDKGILPNIFFHFISSPYLRKRASADPSFIKILSTSKLYPKADSSYYIATPFSVIAFKLSSISLLCFLDKNCFPKLSVSFIFSISVGTESCVVG